MLFKKSDCKRANPALALTVGALAIVGAMSVVKCGKDMMDCACRRMSSMVKSMLKKKDCEMCED